MPPHLPLQHKPVETRLSPTEGAALSLTLAFTQHQLPRKVRGCCRDFGAKEKGLEVGWDLYELPLSHRVQPKGWYHTWLSTLPWQSESIATVWGVVPS